MPEHKIKYTKPQIMDLGPVTDIYGADCTLGAGYGPGGCSAGTTPFTCGNGNAATDGACGAGFSTVPKT